MVKNAAAGNTEQTTICMDSDTLASIRDYCRMTGRTLSGFLRALAVDAIKKHGGKNHDD